MNPQKSTQWVDTMGIDAVTIYNDKPYILDTQLLQTMSAPHIHAVALNKLYFVLKVVS